MSMHLPKVIRISELSMALQHLFCTHPLSFISIPFVNELVLAKKEIKIELLSNI